MRALQNASLHALLIMTARGLSRSGFGDVQILDRREAKQKSRYGGHELLCITTVGGVPFRVVVKVIRDSFRVRMFDELAGVVLRQKADMGILVSPRQGNEIGMKSQPQYRPVRLYSMDGHALTRMIARSHVGTKDGLTPDYVFLQSLEEYGDRVRNFVKEQEVYAR
ncbi:MAG: hypothetical protein ACOYON_05055 [Fimbriimonas sp.]